ncbi:MAG: HEPN domain-containing protein [Candidatus Brockarchaeota archaeon]|nr:HEPN domain-containing protein [Candidatus Brockarchaeota archaeon]
MISRPLTDQAVQLYLKSVILELSGEMPRTHVIRHLFNSLRTILDKPGDIDQFVGRNRSLLIRLEDAYINSRYVSREYEKEEAEGLVGFAGEVIEFLISYGQGSSLTNSSGTGFSGHRKQPRLRKGARLGKDI